MYTEQYVDKLCEENRQLREQNDAYNAFISQFDDDLIDKIKHIDEDSRDGIPLNNPDNRFMYGDYTVFCSSYSKKYHEKWGCSDSFTPEHRNIATKKGLTPCKKCCGKFTPRITSRTSPDYERLSVDLQHLKNFPIINSTPKEYIHINLREPLENNITSQPSHNKKHDNIVFVFILLLIGLLLIGIAIDSKTKTNPQEPYQIQETNTAKATTIPNSTKGNSNTGSNSSSKESSTSNRSNTQSSNSTASKPSSGGTQTAITYLYVLNTSTHKIHEPSCPSADMIADKNYSTWRGSSAQAFINSHPKYSKCQRCNPR